MLDDLLIRVLGVLLEKQLATPDTYPLTLKALLGGCNQKSNRDPEMQMEVQAVEQALQSLQSQGLVLAVSGSGRGTKFRQSFDTKYGVDRVDQAIFAELMLRGPQAPGALKSRIARMGAEANPDEILQRLQALRDQDLCAQHPRRPRERDWRWGHALGAGDSMSQQPASPPEGAVAHKAPDSAEDLATGSSVAEIESDSAQGVLAERVAVLERQIAELRRTLGLDIG